MKEDLEEEADLPPKVDDNYASISYLGVHLENDMWCVEFGRAYIYSKSSIFIVTAGTERESIEV